MKPKSKKQTEKFKINKKMNFSELIQKYPEASEVLMNEGLHCIGCMMASFETLEQGCLSHGLDPDKIVEKINKKLRVKK